ncbi:hypothetical protein A9Q84_20380 [Halobacteriovorax marinus]|uniref:HEXXH motif domain-containing protein n=1 Tax=Halobacteriovorax marinus TaxID=97084 RepID=A0A1Y5F535_9BACT|nr:hypothetical protein A9Q84_20380 [Halobacteriovorax marinus]
MFTQKTVFDKKFHSKIKEKLSQSYEELIFDLREDLNSGYTNDFFCEGFLDRLKEIISDKSLNSYTDLNHYWSNLLENAIYLVQLHEECSESQSNDDEVEFSEVEEEIFNFWNESDLTESFLELKDQDKSVFEVSKILQPLIENQIISFFYLNISKNPLLGEESYIYKAVPEKGDNDKCLYLGENNQLVRLEPPCETFPTMPVVGVNKHENLIFLEGDKRYVITEGLKPITHGNLSLHILPNCEKGFSQIEDISKNVLCALDIIKETSSDLYQTFSSFTHSIIPVDEPGIVSFSQQQLPGYSSINLFERDFVDLIDDLLHENGHHYLNAFLNVDELIIEDDEKIYFSPWRKALRPVRGIYHATFTFYWALELFSSLYKNVVVEDKIKSYQFSTEQKNKITKRFIEEFEMLTYCFTDLKHAHKNKKITEQGWSLISESFKMIESHRELQVKAYKNLGINDLNSINELKSLLSEQRAHFKL